MLSPGRERHGAGNYALTVLLKQDGASIVPLLAALVEGTESEAGDTTQKNGGEAGGGGVTDDGVVGGGGDGGGGVAWSERRSAALVGRCRLTL